MAVELTQTEEEILSSLVSVSIEMAEKYAQLSGHPKLQQAGELMLEWIEEHRAPSGWPTISMAELEEHDASSN